jgi:signal transduction histidine kinase/CheY-like chemotaxis protein
MSASDCHQGASSKPDRPPAVRPEHKSWLLVLLLLLFILPLMGGSYWMYWQSRREIESDELRSDLLRARTLSAIVAQDFRSAKNILTGVSEQASVQHQWQQRDMSSLKVHLQQALKLEPGFLFVGAFEVDGTLRAVAPDDKIVGENFSYRDWYRGVTADWQPYVSEVYQTAVAPNLLVVAVAVPIRDPYGNPSGILMATYSLSQLAEKFKDLDEGATGEFYVIDQHGVLAASPDINPYGQPVLIPALMTAARALSGTEGSGRFQIDGRNMFVGLARVPRSEWTVVYARSETVALAPAFRLRNQNRSAAFYLLLIYFATAGLAAILMQRQTRLLTTNQALNLKLIQARDEAERASKFKDQFLSTMSHELRTPLNAVLGFSDLLADERYGALNDRQQRYVSHIHTGGKHLLKLISDILDLSKIEAGRMELAREDVIVESAFAEVISALYPLAEKKSQALLPQVEPSLHVHADGMRFKQALMNLVGNAIKFTPEGGRIELAARKVGDKVRVEVHDNGPGIPPEQQQRIFEAFVRLSQTGSVTEGTGLGLAITSRLVELHGGRLEIESQPGQGSCFYFSLPIVTATREQFGPTNIAGPRAAGAPRILIVEDNVATGQLIQSQLASSGYETLRCDRPERAIDMAAEFQPDAITLDLLMKPIHGLEVLQRLKDDPLTSKIPVIVVTIADQPAVGSAVGADEYLLKPVDKATLLAAVERCLHSRGRAAPTRAILVVEDDVSTREMIVELLTVHGYAVSTAGDGAEARASVARSLPELVILDLVLPKMSGFDLLAEWRSNPRTAELSVFVLTSKDLSKEEEKYVRAHAESLFQKQNSWREPLIKQLERVVTSTPTPVGILDTTSRPDRGR